jgi:general secretion pathway protein C
MASIAPTHEQKSGPFGTLLVVALVLVLAWQLAYWTWVFVAPAPVRSSTKTENAVDLAIAASLFGASAPASSGAAGASSVRLKGVVAPTPGVAASAIFATGAGRDLSVFIGSEVSPGVTLAEVHPDHVVLSRGGVKERVDLEARRTQAASASPTRSAGFRVNVSRSGPNNFSLSRKELDDALRDPGQLNHLGHIGVPPSGGGARLEAAPPGSLAQKLGLQPGDVIRKVNGQTVLSPGDLARLYQQFGTLSLIQAEIQRGGSTVQLSYAIQP